MRVMLPKRAGHFTCRAEDGQTVEVLEGLSGLAWSLSLQQQSRAATSSQNPQPSSIAKSPAVANLARFAFFAGR